MINKRQINMKLWIAIFLAFIFAIFITGKMIVDYLDLPVIGFDPDGKCKWVETIESGDIQIRKCPVELPTRYHKVYVHYNDAKGE